MRVDDKRYDNQGLHVVLSLFTVDKGKFKVLLIKRKNEPYKNKWILVGGCAYNTETGEQAMERELFEKTNIKNIKFDMFDVFTNPNRSPLKRMIAIGYIGVCDASIIENFKQTEKASDADWFVIDRVPELGYDHKEILDKAISTLKRSIFTTNIMKRLFPNTFTLPELQMTYEQILETKLDRRNFRKKLISANIIEETNQTIKNENVKTTKLYRFTNNQTEFSLYK
ncbi:MAG: NUDIX hydrolase [Clostridia bacterium]|nr:NUDIX hydrolase [Clostridia bacterium]